MLRSLYFLTAPLPSRVPLEEITFGVQELEPSPSGLSVPLAGLEGQGFGALGGSGTAVRLLSALPRLPSIFNAPLPILSYSPTSI